MPVGCRARACVRSETPCCARMLSCDEFLAAWLRTPGVGSCASSARLLASVGAACARSRGPDGRYDPHGTRSCMSSVQCPRFDSVNSPAVEARGRRGRVVRARRAPPRARAPPPSRDAPPTRRPHSRRPAAGTGIDRSAVGHGRAGPRVLYTVASKKYDDHGRWINHAGGYKVHGIRRKKMRIIIKFKIHDFQLRDARPRT